MLPSVEPHVTASTINRELSVLAAFCAYQVRHGVDLAELLTTWDVVVSQDRPRRFPGRGHRHALNVHSLLQT